MNIELRKFEYYYDWGWIRQRVSVLHVEDTCGIMAIDKAKNKTVGCILFDNFLYKSCQATIILESPMVLRSGILDKALDFVFNGIKRDYIFCSIPEINKKSLRLCEHLGGTQKMRIPQGYRKDVDFVVYEIKKDNCPYFQKRKVA